MNRPERGGKRGRRLVTKVVVTYTLEGDPQQRERTLTVRRREGSEGVDGVIWSSALMDRLGYLNGPGGGPAEPVGRRPAQPEDGWELDGTMRAASTLDTSPIDDPPECVWLHRESCTWISLCD